MVSVWGSVGSTLIRRGAHSLPWAHQRDASVIYEIIEFVYVRKPVSFTGINQIY